MTREEIVAGRRDGAPQRSADGTSLQSHRLPVGASVSGLARRPVDQLLQGRRVAYLLDPLRARLDVPELPTLLEPAKVAVQPTKGKSPGLRRRHVKAHR